jgi:hypothetical protein
MTEQCKELVYRRHCWRRTPCRRAAWKDGYCLQHHPDTVAARDAEKDRRYREQQANSQVRRIAKLREQLEECDAELLRLSGLHFPNTKEIAVVTLPTGLRWATSRDVARHVEKLVELVQTGEQVVEDFLPNIASCVLQDYGRMNQFLIAAKQLRVALQEAEAHLTATGETGDD